MQEFSADVRSHVDAVRGVVPDSVALPCLSLLSGIVGYRLVL